MSAHQLVCVSVILLICALSKTVHCVANVDIQQPIVKVSPAKGVSNEDAFGYSVVMHQVQEPTDFESAIQNTRIIVGAPHGTFPGGLSSLPQSPNFGPQNSTGLVYQCPVIPGECGPIGRGELPVFDMFSASNGVRLFDDQPDGSELDVAGGTSAGEQKEGQLMGQILKSSGDHFMACSPLWTADSNFPTNALDNRKNLGRCHLSDKTLTNFVELRPCRGDDNQPGTISSTSNRCQAGFGTSFFSTAVAGDMGVLMGGPGTQIGRGKLYLYDSANSLLASSALDLASEETANFESDEVRPSVYDGWSIVTSNLDGPSGEVFYITSMPRFDGQNISGRVNIRSSNDINNIMDTVMGQQHGEFFGQAVETADLQADQYPDIVVGAPFYSDPGFPDRGRVYLFDNVGGVISDTPVVLTGSGTGGRFGHSVVNLGDVNGDSYEDIAIGAPYEGDPENPDAQGVVYIHYGNPDTLIDIEPSQIIAASSVMLFAGLTDLRSFGFSLSSSVDVDRNGYNDLVVGAYDSQTAVLFRTRSVARIEFNLTSDKEVVPLVTDNTFTVMLCATYDGRGLSDRPLNVSYQLSEMTISGVSRTTDRLYFGELKFPSTGVRTCENTIINLRSIDSLNQDARGEFRLRDPITMIVNFIEKPLPTVNASDPLIDLRDFPLLRDSGNSSVIITPLLECSSGSVCNPDLSISINSVNYIGGRDAIVAGGVTAVQFSLNIQNLASDPAVRSTLAFTLPQPYFTGATIVGSSGITCSTPVQPSGFVCSLPIYISGNSGFDVTVDWAVTGSLTGLEPDTSATFTLDIPPTPDEDMVPGNNAASESLPVTAITDLAVTPSFSGPPRYSNDGPANDPPQSLADLGESVDIQVQVTNSQPSPVPRALLELSVPVNASGAGFYLYVRGIQIPGSNARVSCERDLSIINPDNLISSTRSRRRRSTLVKRQAEEDLETVSESCPFDDPSEACQMFTCNITNLRQPVTVIVQTILDRRFYEEQTGDFIFTAYARITALDDYSQFDINPNNNIMSGEYIVQPPIADLPNLYLEIWLPIIGALLAIIIIIAMFVACIYCGFFRKKRLEQAKKEAGGEFEVRQVPPEEPAVITGDEKKIPGDFHDIGDANDLGENLPDKDPEETSL